MTMCISFILPKELFNDVLAKTEDSSQCLEVLRK